MYKYIPQAQSSTEAFVKKLKDLFEKSGLTKIQTAQRLAALSRDFEKKLSGLDKGKIDKIRTELLTTSKRLKKTLEDHDLEKGQADGIDTAVSQVYGRLRSWLTGRTAPNFDDLLTIADLYEVSICSLLGREETKGKSCGVTWVQHQLPRNSEEKDVLRNLVNGRDNARVLKEAIDLGLVRITGIPDRNEDLEKRIVDSLEGSGFRIAIVIPIPYEVGPDLETTIMGYAAARYFTEVVKPNQKVGLAPGTSIAGLVSSLLRDFGARSLPSLEIYPLAGHPETDKADIGANTLAGTLARHSSDGAIKGYSLTDSSFVLSDPEEYVRSETTTNILGAIGVLNHAFIGIGSMELFGSRLKPILQAISIDMQELIKHAVGDLLYHPIDVHGDELMEDKIGRRICSIPLYQIMLNKQVVAVVCERENESKEKPVYASIKKGYINVLVATESLASSVLELAKATG